MLNADYGSGIKAHKSGNQVILTIPGKGQVAYKHRRADGIGSRELTMFYVHIPPWRLPDGTVIDENRHAERKRPEEVWPTGRPRATFGTANVEM